MTYLLTAHGYLAEAVPDVRSAVRALHTQPPRVVVLDVRLPDGDGLQLARALRGDPRTHTMILVAVTAYAMEGDREAAMQAGCDAYLAKPVNTRDVLVTLQRLLAHT